MTTLDWLMVGAIAVMVLLLFPFAILLTAKLLSYGWMSGRARFEKDQEQRERDRGKSRGR